MSINLNKNSKEFMKLDAEYFILCEELDLESKMAARNNKITWEQYDLITTKYQDWGVYIMKNYTDNKEGYKFYGGNVGHKLSIIEENEH